MSQPREWELDEVEVDERIEGGVEAGAHHLSGRRPTLVPTDEEIAEFDEEENRSR